MDASGVVEIGALGIDKQIEVQKDPKAIAGDDLN